MFAQPLSTAIRFQSTSYGNINQYGDLSKEEQRAANKLMQNMLYSFTVLPEEAPQNTRGLYREYSSYPPRPVNYRRNWMA